MNVAPDQTIILVRQIFLDHRSLSWIGQKIFRYVQIGWGKKGYGSDDFSSVPGEPNWLEVVIFRHWRGIPTDLLDV